MRNTLADLNNHLFAELERLSDEDLDDMALMKEIGRANAICNVSTQIIANGALTVRALQFKENQMSANYSLPDYLEVTS